jgi:hypothetical protein
MRARLTFANVISVIALFVALGGSSYAAVQLSKGQVKKKHLAKNSVVSQKVKDGSLLAQDFKPGELPAGQRGPTGPQGSQGVQGLKGDTGDPGPFPTTLPPGKTLSGVFGLYGVGHVDNGVEMASHDISFTYPLASAPVVGVVRLGAASPPPECSGTVAEPTAPPGWLCVYEGRAQNKRIGAYPGVSAPGSGFTPSASRYGARISTQGQATGTGWFYWSEGTWAVTAHE